MNVNRNPVRFGRGQTFTLITVVALLILIVVGGLRHSRAGDEPSAAPVGQPTAEPTPTLSELPLDGRMGVFSGTDRASTKAFEKWMGRKVSYATDFGPRQTWNDIAYPNDVLKEWKGSGYRLVLAVPMLPTELVPEPLGEPTQQKLKKKLLAKGGRGKFDQYFVTLGENLVKSGQKQAVLRVGWEMNIESWAWGTDDPKPYIAFYRSIVDAMRSVPGQKFTFDWNVNNGFNPNPGEDYYPGDAYVDYVGVDAYDLDGTVYPYPKKCDQGCQEEIQTRAWNEAIFGGPHGLNFWTEFAKEHGKPVSLPEWALWDRYDHSGGADNPLFIEFMHDYITRPSNNVAYANYFNLNSSQGEHSLTKSFPKGAQTFRRLFGG